ncbi:hypothetical protein [Croceibacterium aestuarii]|uniref:hypothetical protein n=1 Tax=Croceibacterium aestuarii TaxID=3064139 RepID=UPI00272DCAFE|nr:hypothetical protein [Croceibacterium sp. D39]
MFKRLILVISISFAAFLALPAHAEEIQLKGDVKVVRTIEEGGVSREERLPPDRVVPGDRLVFTTHFHNTSAEPANDFVVTNPLPVAVMLAKDGDFDVSVDGGQTFGRLAALTVVDGGATPRAAVLGDVTHIRWTIPRIEPGEQGEISYFAVVR